jgi:lysozyme
MAKSTRPSVRIAQNKPKKTRSTTQRKKTTKNKFQTRTWIWVGVSVLLLFLVVLNLLPNTSKREEKQKIEELTLHIPKGFNSFGLDISHHQGTIDWNTILVKNKLDTLINFVYCKATEGTNFIDEEWENNRQSLNEIGIRNGAYHFFNPDKDPIQQAKHFISIWKPRDIDLPPVLDVEVENSNQDDFELKKSMTKWLLYIEKKTGHHPIIYTQDNFFIEKFKNEFLNYNFWIASYTRKPMELNYKRIVHWQYSKTGEIPGINEKVDLNVSKQKL